MGSLGDQRLEALSRLGLSDGATQDEIKTQYRKLALKYHPDMQLTADARRSAEAEFKSIASAYSKLCGASSPVHAAAAGATTAYQRSMRQSGGMSNNFIAALLVIPLGLFGIRVGLGLREQDLKERTGRLNGLMHPPVNEWIAEDDRLRYVAPGNSSSAGGGSGVQQTAANSKPGDGRRIMQRGVMERVYGQFSAAWFTRGEAEGGNGEGGTKGAQPPSAGGAPGGLR